MKTHLISESITKAIAGDDHQAPKVPLGRRLPHLIPPMKRTMYMDPSHPDYTSSLSNCIHPAFKVKGEDIIRPDGSIIEAFGFKSIRDPRVRQRILNWRPIHVDRPDEPREFVSRHGVEPDYIYYPHDVLDHDEMNLLFEKYEQVACQGHTPTHVTFPLEHRIRHFLPAVVYGMQVLIGEVTEPTVSGVDLHGHSMKVKD